MAAAGVVLAGGRSVRMGRDKALLVLDGSSLLEWAVHVLEQTTGEVIVVGRGRPSGWDIPARFVPDDLPGAGPLGGLLTGLRVARRPFVAVVACDMPFLEAATLRALLRLAPGYDAVVPRVDGQAQPLHAVYARGIGPAVQARLTAGKGSLLGLLDGLRVRWVDDDEMQAAGTPLHSLVNVNDPDDWRRVTAGDRRL